MLDTILRPVRPPYRWLRRTMTDMVFDRRYGVRTSGVIELDELGLASGERSRYKPAGLLLLRRILPPREVGPSDVFVDYGSGMGRVVLQAAQYPFRRVIGVELSESLTLIARQNLTRCASRLRCRDVSLVCADALDYELPDDATVVFLNNPFHGHVFAEVTNRLIDSVDRAPRTVRIVYNNPVEEALLLRTGRVRRVRTTHGFRPTMEWSRSNSARMYLLEPRTVTT